ncbi:MAG: hypothetical protein EBS83_10535 [Planctomycetia bacterium]|nr:hypothetical protein [Planctomycetia bacterium]
MHLNQRKEIIMQRLSLLVLTTLWAAAALADDGSILLHGQQAEVIGTTLRYEPQPHKQTLGCWTNSADAAEWTFTAARSGEYAVEVLQGCGRGQGGSMMQLTVDADRPGRQSLAFVVEETGHFQAFKPRSVV